MVRFAIAFTLLCALSAGLQLRAEEAIPAKSDKAILLRTASDSGVFMFHFLVSSDGKYPARGRVEIDVLLTGSVFVDCSVQSLDVSFLPTGDSKHWLRYEPVRNANNSNCIASKLVAPTPQRLTVESLGAQALFYVPAGVGIEIEDVRQAN